MNLARATVHVPGSLYVAQEGASSITAYYVADNGNIAPHAILAGGATTIGDPLSLAVDSTTHAL
jgi:hypothetical protein